MKLVSRTVEKIEFENLSSTFIYYIIFYLIKYLINFWSSENGQSSADYSTRESKSIMWNQILSLKEKTWFVFLEKI